MSEFSDIHAIAESNRVAVDGRVSVKTEDWNTVLRHIEQITRENIILKADREKAISLMEKGWRHNADSYPALLSRFVGMANNQFEKHEKLKKENAELKAALNEIVFKDSKGVWYTSLSEDSDISGIIKNLLD